MKTSDRKRRAYWANPKPRGQWSDIDYAREITDATDTGHQELALVLLAEFRKKFC